jgi:hypothetical protein
MHWALPASRKRNFSLLATWCLRTTILLSDLLLLDLQFWFHVIVFYHMHSMIIKTHESITMHKCIRMFQQE